MRKAKLYASEIVYLDPLGCGSTIGYRIGKGRRGHYWGDVELTDCDKRITWYFSKDRRAVAKIDKAIEILSRFREAFIKAHRRKA